MEKVAAFCKAVPLMVVAVILLGGVTVGTANADSHLPDCKKNPGCLVDHSIDWKIVTAEDIQAVVDSGADVNAKTDASITPLHIAAYAGYAEIIPVLIKAGADVNAKDNIGGTPLHLAAYKGKAKVIPILVKAGADVNELSDDWKTPLDYAKEEKHQNAIRALESFKCYDFLLWQFCP